MRKILVVAAHPDDEVLGCGATIARHIHDGDKVQVVILADGFESRNNGSDRDASAKEASKFLGCETPIFLNFPDNQLDSVTLLHIVKELEGIIGNFLPDTIYTHHYGDLNIDHQVTHRAVMTVCRPQPNFSVKEIYTFEIVSATHWQSVSMGGPFAPNYFVDVSDFIGKKIDALHCYESEMREYPHARSYEALENLAKFRGSSIGVQDAEAFCVERLIN
ncbi:PIG-L family deacetylase [Pseudomonadales bacterium]|nr:PIG-L family deacetylase [Pseudomonadales bacterium]